MSVSEQNTLYQLLAARNCEDCNTNQDCLKCDVEIFKKWIQQKQCEYEQSNKSSGVTLSILEQIFGMLLEDLDK